MCGGLAIKLKNRLENYPKIQIIIEKSFLLIIALLLILSYNIFRYYSNFNNVNNNIKNMQQAKSEAEDKLSLLNNIVEKQDNLNFITYSWWMENLAQKASQSIYGSTSNLNMLSRDSLDNLNKISMSNLLLVDKNNYDNMVKFIIIDKSRGTFITNDRDNINYIKDNLKSFSQENGELYSYVSKKGKWYNISYNSNQSPAGKSGNNSIDNSSNFVEAYWFPANYKYEAEDILLIKQILSENKESITKEAASVNSSLNNMVNEKLSITIKLAIAVTLSFILILMLFLLGKDNLKACIKNNIIAEFIKIIDIWFGQRSTLFKVFFFIISTMTVFAQILLAIVSSSGKVIIIFLIPILIYFIFIFPYIIKFSFYLDRIIKGTEIITGGDINHVIKEVGDRSLQKLAFNINKINRGFKVSIEDQIKNEKLKSELVANVSHDLKTPLTSIINYTDILLREDISEEEKVEFIKILNRKSLKLKTLIEDLFEISKINSGKEEIKMEEVDVAELLKQAISEYSDSELYKDKNLKFILKTYDKKINMNLDGNKMSRVFENLINNALKYSVDNTRVYVSVDNIGKGIKISFKNVSLTALDFDKKEIFERFTRGDKSRNSDIEGNGLGLAIAKSIVELHGGIMYIDFDGDLFKVIIELYY